MHLSDLEYELPEELIAQQPADRRDGSRLMVVERETGAIQHHKFTDLVALLGSGDCLAMNESQVIPARFHARRASGGAIEVLYQHRRGADWVVLLRPSGRLKLGERLLCADEKTELVIEARMERGSWLVRPEPAIGAYALLDAIGEAPLPPYIRRVGAPTDADVDRYQTVYAQTPGSIAAPTAGLHFTGDLLTRLGDAGIMQAMLTLHVGVGTFAPIEVEDLDEHTLQSEWYQIERECVEQLQKTRLAGKRIVSVGTTAARVLESLDARFGVEPFAFSASEGWTNLLIAPPFAFQNVDVLLTNFHLPRSTLLALVMAFGGQGLVREAYAQAVAARYRFYSYGDAMLVL